MTFTDEGIAELYHLSRRLKLIFGKTKKSDFVRKQYNVARREMALLIMYADTIHDAERNAIQVMRRFRKFKATHGIYERRKKTT
jgi:hypothetical protein